MGRPYHGTASRPGLYDRPVGVDGGEHRAGDEGPEDDEPEPRRRVADAALDEVAAVFAGLTDLKTTCTLGHSRGVAALAEGADRRAGLPHADVLTLRRAALFHDLGRVGVPVGVWEKAGPRSGIEWEAVRLHPYHTERILSRAPALQPLALIAGMHHERQDCSGYFRAAPAPSLSPAVRLLCAADAYQAMTQERPHRRARAGRGRPDPGG